MNKLNYFVLYLACIGLISCDDYFLPEPDNTYTDEILLTRPSFVEGLLMQGYTGLPNGYSFNTETATDDAVTNDLNSGYLRLATGEWSSQYGALGSWSEDYTKIYYLNKFLDIYESANYAVDISRPAADNDIRNALYLKRLKGEAHGLRAWYKFELLRAYGGKSEDGILLGFPIVDNTLLPEDNLELPRNTYAESVNSILSDIDVAIANLPDVYVNTGDANFDAVMGSKIDGRINGKAAKALRSRVVLQAASPAFSESSGVSWDDAAKISGEFLIELGDLYQDGITFYSTIDNKELIWNQSRQLTLSWENQNFPPSLFGFARTNPSQNLVDAFPMSNGYPISHELSGYDPDNPYKNRDSRLDAYIIYNGSEFKNSTIFTYEGQLLDGIRAQENSTRTGYYLKKLMDESVSLRPGNQVSTNHIYTIFRETEIHLNFAEAANEAWGPDGDPYGYGFTARTIVRGLRARAGISSTDNYLNGINSIEEMRTLIRNERRLELCFEDFRFWDIRRWNDITTMQEPVRGVYITNSQDENSYDYRVVENRTYEPFMIYGPIPYNETLKYNLKQNNGW
ncbi:RagB/SusD family nutrient uptake outer membrane protein [Cyclobacterium sp. 1_MG-2023]|uniref:RagB/SusD family nutrient uptake outer membrane protein n=1 Tax=Cyclobacterium sp. 1_MG-2023 TaxID=3062681 RepID=UPI0026E19148|nr:RagB/SusD family nutrient uptake outer membrane protein [Cyclobacterium sp. 1_MG-2023]MDO6439571.1 RagB/SusD family nutrient uptake outer membrane protein [Cyclobacterium sp. 1_MG-2023]